MARSIKIAHYTYTLPEDKIAFTPLEQRDQSKLLLYKDRLVNETVFHDIPNLLPPQSLLVFNTTKVVCARMLFQSEQSEENHIEIFILEPLKGSIEQAMLQQGEATWKCLVGRSRKFKKDFIQQEVEKDGQSFFIKAYKPVPRDGYFEVRLEWNPDRMFADILNIVGKIPLPPYIKRVPLEGDMTRYQTVYAQQEGSVAAPTAGLHFTEDVLKKLDANNHQKTDVVLHIGAGTFKPVKAETMEEHSMHTEEIHVTRAALESLVQRSERLVAVGTTSLRTLESLFWFGLKLKQGSIVVNVDTTVDIQQWDPYDMQVPPDFDYTAALKEILTWMHRFDKKELQGKTGIIIAPGYQIRSVQALVTNFHQPNSTLLLLVAAAVGEDWRKIYDYALKNDFRFLSYGDSSLLYVKR